MSEDSARELARVRAAALAALARREHGFRELLERLAERFPELDPYTRILPVLEALREAGLQSDSRFLENFVRYRSQRGTGPLKIAAELRPRGLDAGSVEQALRTAEIDWFESCRQVLQRKLGGRPLPSPREASERLRLQRFLLQRGFTQEQVREAFKVEENQ